MTYGFKFLNNYDDTVLDDSNVKPWFYGQATVIGVPEDITSNYAGVLNKIDADGLNYTNFSPGETWSSNSTPIPNRSVSFWTVYKIKYAVPTQYNCFVLFNLPVNNSNVYYSCPTPVSLTIQVDNGTTPISNGIVEMYAFVPNTWSASVADIPKAYVFVADPIPNSKQTTGYGVKLFNQLQQCMFDSGVKHLQPTAFPGMMVSGDFTSPRDYTRELYSQPSNNTTEYAPNNAAWLLPYCRWVWVYPEGGTVYNNFYEVLYRRDPTYNNSYNINPMASAEVATYRTVGGDPNFVNFGMYFGVRGDSTSTNFKYLPTMVVDATLLDEGYVPPSLPQTFTLTKDKAGISEAPSYTDNRITITLTTVSVPNGTVVPFTITGIEAADINPLTGFTSTLTGSFLVIDNTASKTIQAVNDTLVEGTQTATLTLDNGKASINFTISDSISYSLSSYMTPEEGQSIAVTLTTQGVANGGLVPYVVTGISAADLTVGTLTGNFTINNNTSLLEFRFAKDQIDDYETMRISVNSGATYLDIPITNVPYANEVLTISPNNITANQTTVVTITGGIPFDLVEFITLDQGIDPVYAWNNRWKTEYASQVGTINLDENGAYFNNPTGTGFGVGNKTLWIFTSTSKNFRSANITVAPEATFSITGSDGTKGPITLNEGTTGYFKVTTTNIPNGTLVYPKFINTDLDANDYTNSAASGVAIQNGVANFTIAFTADLTTEGSQSGQLVVQYPNGTTKDSYGTITVGDTSLTPPVYSVSRYVASVNENGFQFFTIGLSNVPVGTQLWWDLSGTGVTTNDIQTVYHDAQDGNGWFVPSGGSTLNNTFTTDGSTSYQVIIYPRSDLETEGPETVTFKLRTGYSGGNVEASTSFVINDTSTTPVPVTYNESLTVVSDAWNDYIVELNNYMTISITGGAPNTGFTFAITNNTDPQPTSFPGSATLDSNGSWTNYITGATFQGSQTTGDRRLWVKFNYDNNVRSARVKIVYDAGTTSSGTFCVGTTLTQSYNDGHGGTYNQTVQTNSPSCGGGITQYYPAASQSTYYYYLSNNSYDIFQVTGARPGGTVRFGITSGIYAGVYYDRTANSSGVATYDPGVGAYTAGTYTANITFPGEDAYYPVGYRTLSITWVVVAGGGGGGGLTVSNYSYTKQPGWEAYIDVYGTPSASYDGIRVKGAGVDNIDYFATRTFTTNVSCTISYRLTPQSENNYDFGYFYIDNVEKIKLSGVVGDGVNGSGAYQTMTLAAGTHTIKVRYTKDSSVSSGTDCVFGEWSLA